MEAEKQNLGTCDDVLIRCAEVPTIGREQLGIGRGTACTCACQTSATIEEATRLRA